MSDDRTSAEKRSELEALLAENKDMSTQIAADRLDFAIEDAGFDPDGTEAKVIRRTYEGEEVTPEVIAEFAREEYGFEPTPAEDDPATQAMLAAEARAAGEDRLGALASGSLPTHAPSTDDEIRLAEANGDWETYDRLQAQKLQTARRGVPEYRGG